MNDQKLEAESKENGNQDINSKEDTDIKDRELESCEVKRNTRNIFICYSSDASYLEKRFVSDTVKQFKENGLSDDIWFDKDEQNIDSCCWFSQYMKAAEKCLAAVLILSVSFFDCPVTIYALNTLIDRLDRVTIYSIMYEDINIQNLPVPYHTILAKTVDLTSISITNISEKASTAVGALNIELEKYATCFSVLYSQPTLENHFTGAYKQKMLCNWNVNDMQEWLQDLGVREFYRQMFAESFVNGFLVMSLTEYDLETHLNIDSRLARKKIMSQIVSKLNKEHKVASNWHMRCKTMKVKPLTVYIIADPSDMEIMKKVKPVLLKKNYKVFHHGKLGQSKEEFLKENGPVMASCAYVLVCLSHNSAKSPFSFQEIMFTDWIGKKMVVLLHSNPWSKLRSSLKSVLGDYPAVDFVNRPFNDAMNVLTYYLNPTAQLPGVVLEQDYINKMAQGVQTLATLAYTLEMRKKFSFSPYPDSGPEKPRPLESSPSVFISFQWDTAEKAQDIKCFLEKHGFSCWTDVLNTSNHSDSLQGYLQKTMNSAKVLLCCITPKYIQSDNCAKDICLADLLRKEIVPLMMTFTPWPPESAPSQVRKVLSRLQYIDLSNDKLVTKNLQVLLETVHHIVNKPAQAKT